MKIKCKYCGSFIDDTEEKCPNCGGVNDNLRRVGEGVPTTIEELKEWYINHNLPNENITRFFIGKDYKNPRAFGIYFDEKRGLYVVYKNKDDGERKIRYEGTDEKYAVNELYLRLKEEIVNQKQKSKRNVYRTNIRNDSNNFGGPLFIVHLIAVFILMITTMHYSIWPGLFLFLSLNPGMFIMMPILNAIKDSRIRKITENIWHIASLGICMFLMFSCVINPIILHSNDAYYQYDDITYYNYGKNWYYYDDYSWNLYSGNINDFKYLGNDYDYDYGVTDFEDSEYYENHSWGSSSSSDDWDSGSSWDSSDSWDSGGSDWSSDW